MIITNTKKKLNFKQCEGCIHYCPYGVQTFGDFNKIMNYCKKCRRSYNEEQKEQYEDLYQSK